jgi:dienelactone hydrolase
MNASDFEKYSFDGPLTTGEVVEPVVYFAGSGPAILLIQELPGIDKDTFKLTERLIAQGYTVYIPHLVGQFGKKTGLRNTARLFCVRKEINIFAKGKQSPISSWLRALCQDIKTRSDGANIGVIGMCLSGSFALALMADDAVLGAVSSQPSLPVMGGSALDMSAQDVQECKAAMAAKGGALAMRYKDDKIARGATMEALNKAFEPHIKVIQFAGSEHSLLTSAFHQKAYDETISYFAQRFAG